MKSISEPQVMSSIDNAQAYVNGVLPGKRQRVEVRTAQENDSTGGPVGKLYCSSFSFSRSGDPMCEIAPTAKMPSYADDVCFVSFYQLVNNNLSSRLANFARSFPEIEFFRKSRLFFHLIQTFHFISEILNVHFVSVSTGILM